MDIEKEQTNCRKCDKQAHSFSTVAGIDYFCSAAGKKHLGHNIAPRTAPEWCPKKQVSGG